MPLHVAKYERRDHTDRTDLALAALEACRSARATAGVNSSRFYWVNPDEIAIVTDAEPGAWGQGSGNQPGSRAMKAMFELADLARNTSVETWADARSGEETFKISQT
jgi:hypothetical protein